MSSNLCSEDLSGGSMVTNNYTPIVDKNLIELRQKASSFNQPNGYQNEMEGSYSQSPPALATVSGSDTDLRATENSRMISVLLGNSLLIDLAASSAS